MILAQALLLPVTFLLKKKSIIHMDTPSEIE
jgi:hypothetical protein